MLAFLIILICAINNSYATPSCHELHKTQLASLTERMNQMLSSLYTPAKPESNATPPAPSSSSSAAAASSQSPAVPFNTFYPYSPYSIPAQVVYVSPPPATFIPPPIEPSLKPFKNLYYPQKDIAQPFDFAFPGSIDAPSPWMNYFEQYPHPHYVTPQYSPTLYPPQSLPYPPQPMPYPPPYPYPEYPAYPKVPSYPPVPSFPPYPPPPQAYPPPPTPYSFPPPYYA